MIAETTTKATERRSFAFAAIDRYITTNIVGSDEKMQRGKEWISWGDGNRYPAYLDTLYNTSATLQTIINGISDFVCGNGVMCNIPRFAERINRNDDTMDDLVHLIVTDYLKYGGFAFCVIRSRSGEIAELQYIDISRLRTDKKREVFYYSEEWSNNRVRTVKYPKYKYGDSNGVSIVYYEGNKTRGVYPVPIWNAAVRSAEIDRQITDFHLNAISNGFSGGYAFNFNNGIPDDEQKAEIERNVNDKFSGADNAGRIVMSFNQDREHALDIVKLDTDDLDKKYELVREWVRQQLFIAFRAIPCLFGLMTENNGFSREEFLQAFELYNQTMVKPIQQIVVRVLDKVLGGKDSISILPFSLDVTDDISE